MHNLLNIHWDNEERGSLILFRKLKDCVARWGDSHQHGCSLLSDGIPVNLPHWCYCRSEGSRSDFLMHGFVHPRWLCRLFCVQWRTLLQWRRLPYEEIRKASRMFYVSLFVLNLFLVFLVSVIYLLFWIFLYLSVLNNLIVLLLFEFKFFLLPYFFVLFISYVFRFISSIIRDCICDLPILTALL